jgi:predicted DNA-binding transcriptional regulator AlpA
MALTGISGADYNDPTPASRLRYLLARAGLSERQAAHELEVTDRQMLSWCSGREKPPKSIFLAVEFLIQNRVTEIPTTFLVGVKEAAAMMGLHTSNFVRDHANKENFPRPVHTLATGRVWLRADVDHYLMKYRHGNETGSSF